MGKGSKDRCSDYQRRRENHDRAFCKHDMEYLRTSDVTLDGKKIRIEVRRCRKCELLYIIDNVNGGRVDCKGLMGAEI